MMDRDAPPLEPLKIKTLAAEIAPDGEEMTLVFADAAGRELEASALTSEMPDLLSAIESHVQRAYDLQGRAARALDPRMVGRLDPKPVTRLQGTQAPDGTPVLSVEIDGRIRWDLALSGADLAALAQWLVELHLAAAGAPPEPD